MNKELNLGNSGVFTAQLLKANIKTRVHVPTYFLIINVTRTNYLSPYSPRSLYFYCNSQNNHPTRKYGKTNLRKLLWKKGSQVNKKHVQKS